MNGINRVRVIRIAEYKYQQGLGRAERGAVTRYIGTEATQLAACLFREHNGR